ncbi:MAG: DUF3379 family protein [Burkholderiales bacterium]
MNCMEFRRSLLAQPHIRNQALDEHECTCAACAEYAKRSDAFELKLAQAVEVPVDSSLESRIMLNHNLRRHGRAGNWTALAASVVAAVGVTVGAVLYSMAPDPGLLTASIEHVSGEPGAMKAQQKVSQQEMIAALGLSGASIKDGFINVTYLHDCPVPGGFGKHIVLQTEAGKITLITMPSQNVARSKTRKQGGFIAAVHPAKIGSYALVADNDAAFRAGEKIISQNVSWRV